MTFLFKDRLKSSFSVIAGGVCFLFFALVIPHQAYAVFPDYDQLSRQKSQIIEGASNGDADDQMLLGYLYQHGDLSKNGYPDYYHAIQYFRKSAAQHNAQAEFALGHLHEYGQGLQFSGLLAIPYYERAASLGNTDAEVALGRLYENGKGIDTSIGFATVNRDYKRAFFYYKKAAEAGNSDGMYHLGTMYDNGYSIRQNTQFAAEWYRKAVELGNFEAAMSLGYLSEIEGIRTDNIKRLREAEDLYGKACDGGIESGCEDFNRLKAAQPSNKTISIDELLLRKRIVQGDVVALFDMGRFYEAEQNISECKRYMSLSCAAGYTRACSAYFE